jgi:hypothetical protein
MLIIVMLSAVILNIVMLRGIMLSAVLLNIVILTAMMLNIVILNVVLLKAFVMNDILLSAVMPSVNILGVVIFIPHTLCPNTLRYYDKCRYAECNSIDCRSTVEKCQQIRLLNAWLMNVRRKDKGDRKQKQKTTIKKRERQRKVGAKVKKEPVGWRSEVQFPLLVGWIEGKGF